MSGEHDCTRTSLLQPSNTAPARFVAEDGVLLGALPAWADEATLQALYRAMVLTRLHDEKAVALQRTGRLGTYASSLGQEAVGIGLASAMAPEDVLVPSFREQGAQFWRGVTLAFETAHEVTEHLPGFIVKYNTKRLHSALGYLSPEQYEKQHARPQVKDVA